MIDSSLNQEINGEMRKVGLLFNLNKSYESIFSLTGHLLVGFLGGLPLEAVSLRLSIVFLFSAILEIPSGAFSDWFGHLKTVILGECIELIGVFLLFFTFFIKDQPIPFWICLSLSSLLSGLGTSLNSGTKESIYQKRFDFISQFLSCENKKEIFKEKAFSLSIGHGKSIPPLLSVFSLSLLLFLHYYFNSGHYILLLAVLLKIATLGQFFRLKKEIRPHQKKASFKTFLPLKGLKLNDYNHSLESNLSHLVIIVCTIMMIHIHSFLVISNLRTFSEGPFSFKSWLPFLLLQLGLEIAQYLKGFTLPFFAKRYQTIHLTFISMTTLTIFTGLTVIGSELYPSLMLPFYFLFACFFRPLVSLALIPQISCCLVKTTESSRATVLSIQKSMALFLYSLYTSFLSLEGTGSMAPNKTVVFIIPLALILALTYGFYIILNKKERFNHDAPV